MFGYNDFGYKDSSATTTPFATVPGVQNSYITTCCSSVTRQHMAYWPYTDMYTTHTQDTGMPDMMYSTVNYWLVSERPKLTKFVYNDMLYL